MPQELATVLATLAVDATAVEVLSAMDDAGIEAILLRGPALQRLLYERCGERAYIDCDVLVAPDEFQDAERVLERLGFQRRFAADDAPVPALHHADPWRRIDTAEVDLHRTVAGVAAPVSRAWAVLRDNTQPLRLGSFQATALNEPGLALVVALHAAQHGPRKEKPLQELDRALGRLERSTWVSAARLAEQLGARSALAAGLRRRPSGALVADELGLPRELPVEVALRVGGARYMSLGLERIAAARGLRAKLRLARSALLPSRVYMRAASGLAKRGTVGLTAAYVMHAARVPIFIFPALASWRRARRLASGRVSWRRAG